MLCYNHFLLYETYTILPIELILNILFLSRIEIIMSTGIKIEVIFTVKIIITRTFRFRLFNSQFFFFFYNLLLFYSSASLKIDNSLARYTDVLIIIGVRRDARTSRRDTNHSGEIILNQTCLGEQRQR